MEIKNCKSFHSVQIPNNSGNFVPFHYKISKQWNRLYPLFTAERNGVVIVFLKLQQSLTFSSINTFHHKYDIYVFSSPSKVPNQT